VSLDDESRTPSRIILPGGGKPGGLVGPDGRPLGGPAGDEGADGASAAPGEPATPTHPRLRPVELQEATEAGRSFVVLIDPTGVAKEALAVSAEAMPILMLLDGSVALTDLIALVDRETGDPRAGQGARSSTSSIATSTSSHRATTRRATRCAPSTRRSPRARPCLPGSPTPRTRRHSASSSTPSTRLPARRSRRGGRAHSLSPRTRRAHSRHRTSTCVAGAP
jgi:hypothetical protein